MDTANRPKTINVMLLVTQMELAGAQHVMLHLARDLPQQSFHVHAGCLYEKSHLRDLESEFGVRITDFRFKEAETRGIARKIRMLLGGSYRLFRFLRKQRIHVLNTHCFYANLIGTVIGRLARVPVIIITQQSVNHCTRRTIHVLDRIAATLATKCIAVSQATKDYCVDREGFAPEKTVVIRNATSFRASDDPKQAVERVRAELGLDDAAVVLATVSRMAPHKGHRYLIDAFAKVLEQAPLTVLLLVGDGEERPALTAQARELGLGDAIRFVGLRTDIPEILDCIDVLVHPSLKEGLPMAVLEAMSHAKPIVAAAADGIPEVVDHEVSGLLVSPGDVSALAEAILTLVGDERKRREYGAAGAQALDANHSVSRMLQLYESLFLSSVGSRLSP